MRRTKIVATLGPVSRDPEKVRKLIAAGVDVFRLNLAHPGPPEHRAAVDAVREQADAEGRFIGILADLPGPKMRTGPIADGEVALEVGQTFTLRSEGPGEGDETGVSTTVDNLPDLVEEDDEIFLADGAIILRVSKRLPDSVETEVVRRGLLRSRKGMHIPKAESKVRAFSDEDEESLAFALDCKVDLIGLSFVRNADDIRQVVEALPKRGPRPFIVAKIETGTAVANLAEIVREADAVMVARGDLGIQLPYEDVPHLQKRIIRTCNAIGTPVITATQMLESMTHSPLPSRAEVNDVANAVLDGTDALMLSEETAVGSFPVGTVKAMASIARRAEGTNTLNRERLEHHEERDDPVSWAMARAAVHVAEELKVKAIVCPTRSGATARRVAAFRPSVPIIGLAHSKETIRPLSIVWGVVPAESPFLPEEQLASEGLGQALKVAREAGLARSGDLVAVVAGGPAPRAGSTDFVRVVTA